MNNQERIILDLQAQIAKLRVDLESLSQNFYKNNFSSIQNFNKDAVFNSRLKVPHYDSPPAISEVGDLVEIGGVLYIGTAVSGTFELVGTQN